MLYHYCGLSRFFWIRRFVITVKSTVEISQTLVAFSEYMNYTVKKYFLLLSLQYRSASLWHVSSKETAFFRNKITFLHSNLSFKEIIGMEKSTGTSPKGFSASKCDVGNWIFTKLETFWEIVLMFWFFGGIFWKNFFGGFFGEDFLGGMFKLLKSAKLFEYERNWGFF